jgi:hypothetical protein
VIKLGGGVVARFGEDRAVLGSASSPPRRSGAAAIRRRATGAPPRPRSAAKHGRLRWCGAMGSTTEVPGHLWRILSSFWREQSTRHTRINPRLPL